MQADWQTRLDGIERLTLVVLQLREMNAPAKYAAQLQGGHVLRVTRRCVNQSKNDRKGECMSQATASKALSKYKVIDLTRARAGPTAARQLADWGHRSSKSKPQEATKPRILWIGTALISKTCIATNAR